MAVAAEAVRTEERYLDREFSWLAFNTRVLELAEDPDVPLLERARFLAIFSSNLDGFFMIRLAGLKRRIAAGVAVRAASGLLPREVHEGTLARTRALMTRQANCFHDDVRPALAKEGIEIARWDDLDDAEHNRLREQFRERIFPVLTPLAVDPAHPFPYISGLSLNLAVVLRNRGRPRPRPRPSPAHCAGTALGPEVPGNQSHDRRQDQGRADTLQHRPAKHQDRQIRGQRGANDPMP